MIIINIIIMIIIIIIIMADYTHTHRVQTLYLGYVWVGVILLLGLDG